MTTKANGHDACEAVIASVEKNGIPVKPVDAYTSGCKECIATGSTWVHLRECLTCGITHCCDSSPNRHATAHYHKTAHPVVQSVEPGESWRYCYPTDSMVG